MLNKTFISAFLLLFISGACSVLPSGRKLPDPQSLAYAPIRFSPPAPERIVLENGLVVYLLEDHELPLIEISALIRTGAVYEPAELAGLASITGSVMRTGGTLKMAPEEVDRQIERISASISVGINPEEGTASLSVLKEDSDTGLDIFSQILTQPAFNQEKLALAKSITCQGLRRLTDNPQSFAFREFKKLLYSSNPRGNLPTIASVKKITRKDLVKFHQTFFQPDRALLAVSGDFSRDEMLDKIKKRFSGWKGSSQAVPQVATPQQVSQINIHHLQKDISQSTIVMGHLAPQKSHPDYFSFQVLDFILGSGGFNSRLMSEIRSTRGLAYSVGSFYRGDVDYGVWGAYCITKAQTTHKAFSLMIDIVNEIKKGNIAREEIAWAKESLVNSFIFSYTSSAQIAAQQMALEYEKLPSDFLSATPEKLQAVTLEDVQRAAQQYLSPSNMVVLTIGDARAFDRPVEAWEAGTVYRVTSDILNEQ